MPPRKNARVKVKICGITNWTDARQACAAGADFLGFNFWPRSPRYITPAKAHAIVRRLPKEIASVGVFVNEPESSILKIAQSVGLQYIQLHGEESPATVGRLQRILPVIKAIRVRESFRPGELAPYHRASAILLDGFDNKLPGGTGKTFAWVKARGARGYAKIFLAGGLTPENIAGAIQAAQPFALDACSSLESKPGKKNPARVQAFVQSAKNAGIINETVKRTIKRKARP